MTIELKIAGEKDSEKWDELVASSPHGTIFHTWKWLKIVEKHTRTKLYPIIGLKGSVSIGVYPLFLQKKLFTNIVFSPPSRALLVYLGPVFCNYDELKQNKKESVFVDFQKKVDEFLHFKIKYNYTRIRAVPELVDFRPFLWAGYRVEPLYTYIIDLTGGFEHIWKNFNKQVRIDIKKTGRGGVGVRLGSGKELGFLKKSVADRLIDQGLDSGDYSDYLEDIHRAFSPDNFKIFVGEYKGETVGGLTLLCYKNRASLWLGVPKTDLKGIYPNDLVVWESIKWACENGFKQYELMDAGNDPRLRHFKSKFNPGLSFWYSAEKYSSPIYKGMQEVFRFYQQVKK